MSTSSSIFLSPSIVLRFCWEIVNDEINTGVEALKEVI
jgi:hypothetical protein